MSVIPANLGVGSTVRSQKAAATKAARRARYRSDFMNDTEWAELAREAGLRLPQWGTAPTPAAQRKWLLKLGLPQKAYLKWAGMKKFSTWQEYNPDWPLRAWVGLVLEHRDQILAQKIEKEQAA